MLEFMRVPNLPIVRRWILIWKNINLQDVLKSLNVTKFL